MSDFFHSWRRKLGVSTLLVACMLMIGWIRSEFVRDHADFPFWRCLHRFDSHNGHIALHRRWMENDDINITDYYENIRWRTSKLGQHPDLMSYMEIVSVSDGWLSEHFGKAISHTISITYWSAVTPLTLLSAWLLLSKPRYRASTSTANATD